MQQSLEKRISALEQAQPQGVKVIFIIFGSLGEQDNETEEAFKERATSETPRKENQVAMLFGEFNGCGV